MTDKQADDSEGEQMPVLTKEEADLVVGAIPLQALPRTSKYDRWEVSDCRKCGAMIVDCCDGCCRCVDCCDC